jgi:hypothetical protein
MAGGVGRSFRVYLCKGSPGVGSEETGLFWFGLAAAVNDACAHRLKRDQYGQCLDGVCNSIATSASPLSPGNSFDALCCRPS